MLTGTPMDTRLVRAAWAWLSNDDLDGVVGPATEIISVLKKHNMLWTKPVLKDK